MQRLLSVYDWQKLPVGEAAIFPSDLEQQRAVRFRVNAPSPVALFVKQDDIEDELFLAYVVGYDELQFEIAGSYKLFAMGGDVYFDTLDGTRAEVEAFDPTSFTNIVERQARNPEMELIERKMQENMERRMAAIMDAMGSELAARDRAYELERTAAKAASAPASELPAPVVTGATETGQVSGATGGQSDETA